MTQINYCFEPGDHIWFELLHDDEWKRHTGEVVCSCGTAFTAIDGTGERHMYNTQHINAGYVK